MVRYDGYHEEPSAADKRAAWGPRAMLVLEVAWEQRLRARGLWGKPPETFSVDFDYGDDLGIVQEERDHGDESNG